MVPATLLLPTVEHFDSLDDKRFDHGRDEMSVRRNESFPPFHPGKWYPVCGHSIATVIEDE